MNQYVMNHVLILIKKKLWNTLTIGANNGKRIPLVIILILYGLQWPPRPLDVLESSLDTTKSIIMSSQSIITFRMN